MYRHGEYKPKDIYTRYGRLLVYLTWFLIHSFFWFVFFLVYCILVMIRCILCVYDHYMATIHLVFFFWVWIVDLHDVYLIIYIISNERNLYDLCEMEKMNEWMMSDKWTNGKKRKRKRLVHEKHSTKQQQKKSLHTSSMDMLYRLNRYDINININIT